MQIILTQEIHKLGHPGDVVKVADGYARNYLLPQKFAILATPVNLKKVTGIKEEAEAARQALINELKAKAAKLRGVELVFVRKSHDDGQLYGSVTEGDIAAMLEEKGFELHKGTIVLEKHIKNIGEYEVHVHLGKDIESAIKVQVRDEEGKITVAKEETQTVETTEETVTMEMTVDTDEPTENE